MLKTRSARMTWARYPDELRKFYWRKDRHLFWTDSYFVTTVGYNSLEAVDHYVTTVGYNSLEAVDHYIKNQ